MRRPAARQRATPRTGGSTTGGTTGAPIGDGGPFVTIPLNGCPPLDYQGAVTIGGQTFEMEVDTGSTDTAIALSTCSNCSVTPEYSPASGVCSSQTTSSQFGSGSWNAEVCSTTVQVGGEMPDVTIDFGGITSQTQFFQNATCDSLVTGQQNPSPYQGILGLGPIDLDTIGQSNDDAYFNELVANGVTDTMATLLCSSGGLLWFGGYDPQYATAGASVQYTPMTNSGYWSVSLSGIGLGTTSLGGADTNAIVDTGTGAFLMGASAISSLESQLASNSGATSTFGSGALGSNFFNGGINCIQPTGGQTTAQIDAALPPLTLTFPTASGGKAFTLNMPASQSLPSCPSPRAAPRSTAPALAATPASALPSSGAPRCALTSRSSTRGISRSGSSSRATAGKWRGAGGAGSFTGPPVGGEWRGAGGAGSFTGPPVGGEWGTPGC